MKKIYNKALKTHLNIGEYRSTSYSGAAGIPILYNKEEGREKVDVILLIPYDVKKGREKVDKAISEAEKTLKKKQEERRELRTQGLL